MTRKRQEQIPEEIAKGQTPESIPEPKSERLPGLGGASPIQKPSAFSLDKFKSKRPTAPTGVSTLLGALPHYPLAEAKDFVRLHPDETYWSAELCFVDCANHRGRRKGITIHLIVEDLAIKYLPAGKIMRHSLALASKPYDVFFLATHPDHQPRQLLEQIQLGGLQVGEGALGAIDKSEVTGAERYDDHVADLDAFPEPKWPRGYTGERSSVRRSVRPRNRAGRPPWFVAAAREETSR